MTEFELSEIKHEISILVHPVRMFFIDDTDEKGNKIEFSERDLMLIEDVFINRARRNVNKMIESKMNQIEFSENEKSDLENYVNSVMTTLFNDLVRKDNSNLSS